MIVLDTSVVLAFMDRRDADHEHIREWMKTQEEELITTPLVVAELDHLVLRQGGPAAARAIRVNLVVPGLIDTSLGRLAGKADPSRQERPIPLGREGTAWEIAHAASFLLSDEASYITGHALLVDGGLQALR